MTPCFCRRRRLMRAPLAALATLAALTAFLPPAFAQAMPSAPNAPAPWPTKPLRFVVGFAAGGTTDVLARLVGARMSEQLGQPVLVENRGGAGSNLGAEVVARAPADGQTLYVYSIANTINATLYAKLGYDPVKDFEFIGLIAKIPNVLVVNPRLPVQSVADYQRFARESRDGVTFASSGSGSSIHLSGEMFKMQARLNLLHVPYKGSAPAVTDLIGGQVQSMFDNMPSSLPHVQAGKLRPIAVTSAQRSPLLPQVPTLAESGFPGFDVQSWFALVAPAGTPRPVVDRLNAALNKALAVPDIRQRLQDMGATAEPGTPEQLRSFALAEVMRWREVVKASGARVE